MLVKRILENRIKKNLENTKLLTRGTFSIDNKMFHFHHGLAFHNSYIEIIKEQIYKFKTDKEAPLIIDCGANMGLSVLFFAKNYPKSKIIAFEPDTNVLPTLEKNISTYLEHHDFTLYKKAVWTEDTVLDFYTDGGLGGRVGVSYENKQPRSIEALRLRTFLEEEIDFLKIDIEGAEYEVLLDCKEKLKNVKCLFVEYHSVFNETQRLDDILQLLKGLGFRYHLKESFSRSRPFVDTKIVCQKFDMAINIFAYKE